MTVVRRPGPIPWELMTGIKPRPILAVSLLLVFVACTDEGSGDSTTSPPASSSPSTVATTTADSPAGTSYGFFPFPNGDTFEAVVAHFSDLSEHADVLLMQPNIAWEEFVGDSDQSESRENLRNMALLADQHGLNTIYIVDPLNGLNRQEFLDLPADWDASFANPDVREAMTNLSLWILGEFEPRYLGLSSEINTYLEAHPDEIPHYLSLYGEIYDAIKAESPETQVFVTFQWEQVNGVFLGSGQLEPAWEQIELFEPNLDLWAISSYPFAAFDTAADIPDDYYSPLLARTDKQLAVAEGGFISRPTGPFAGTPQDQVDQLASVHDQIGSRLDFWINLILDDFDPAAIADPMREQGRSESDITTLGLFASIGLREYDGTPKPAMAIWDTYRSSR